MARKTLPQLSDYATVTITHHAVHRERAETIRRRPGPKSARPECMAIGHAWTEDTARHGGLICLACSVVRWP